MADPTPEDVQRFIAQGLACDHVEVDGDGRHFFATIVSAEFEGSSRIARHQRVYKALGERMLEQIARHGLFDLEIEAKGDLHIDGHHTVEDVGITFGLAVAAGHHKRTMFTVEERLEIARELAQPYKNVEVVAFRGLLRDFVVANHGKVVVRGLRAVSDFEYEFQMAGMNRQLMPDVETLFLTPSDQYQFISGTFVREIAALGGDVSKFVAPLVLSKLKDKISRPREE